MKIFDGRILRYGAGGCGCIISMNSYLGYYDMLSIAQFVSNNRFQIIKVLELQCRCGNHYNKQAVVVGLEGNSSVYIITDTTIDDIDEALSRIRPDYSVRLAT